MRHVSYGVRLIALSAFAIALLSGCQKKYDTKEQCELEELKKAKSNNNAAYQAVVGYCESLFAKKDVTSSYDGKMKDPNWVRANSANKSEKEVYYDSNSINRPESGIVDFWIKIVVDPKVPKNYELSLNRIDCVSRKVKGLSSTIYINDEISEQKGGSDWTDIKPGREGAYVLNRVCT